jgi:hypothetical protein
VVIHGAGDSAWYWHLLEPKYVIGATGWSPWISHLMEVIAMTEHRIATREEWQEAREELT